MVVSKVTTRCNSTAGLGLTGSTEILPGVLNQEPGCEDGVKVTLQNDRDVKFICRGGKLF